MTPREDTPELRAEFDARLARVNADKDNALFLLDALSSYTTGMMTSDRLAHTDTWNLYMDQQAATDLLRLIREAESLRAELARNEGTS